MKNNRLLPYETIIQATSGEPEAVNLVLQHYSSITGATYSMPPG